MSGVLRIAAEMNLLDVTTPGSARYQYVAGPTNVDFFGPAPLLVEEAGRRRALLPLLRDVRVAWDGQVARNKGIIAALREAADRIENGGDAAEELVPMLLSAITQAVGGDR